MDRADIKAYIGPPGLSARYDILRSCVRELAAKGVIAAAGEHELPPHWSALPPPALAAARAAAAAAGAAHATPAASVAAAAAAAAAPPAGPPLALPPGEALLVAAAAAEGLSGRALRKLPFLAHATARDTVDVRSAAGFLRALHAAVLLERADRAAMGTGAR